MCPMASKSHSTLCICPELAAAEIAAEVEAMMEDTEEDMAYRRMAMEGYY
jgi:hypothetical protein